MIQISMGTTTTLVNGILSDVYSGATSLISTNVGQFILLGVGLVIGFALVRFGVKWVKKGFKG